MNCPSDGLRLMLPWPDPILNPNVQAHWSKKKGAKRAAREWAFVTAYNMGVSLDPAKRYRMSLVFCPPDGRSRDLDNLGASMKWSQDGLCLAFGINDRMIRPVPDWGPRVEGGKVEVLIVEEANHEQQGIIGPV